MITLSSSCLGPILCLNSALGHQYDTNQSHRHLFITNDAAGSFSFAANHSSRSTPKPILVNHPNPLVTTRKDTELV